MLRPTPDSRAPAISAYGRYVAFHTFAGNLVPGDTNASADVFVHDLVTGHTQRVSVDSAGAEADKASFGPSISGDGRYVAFNSDATNLVPDDTNQATDAFVHDLVTGQTQRVSVDSAGAAQASSGFDPAPPAISEDGRYVAFDSDASNLVPSDTNEAQDVFVHDVVTGQTRRVSVNSAGPGQRFQRQRSRRPPGDQRQRPVRGLHLGRDQPRPGGHQRIHGRVPPGSGPITQTLTTSRCTTALVPSPSLPATRSAPVSPSGNNRVVLVPLGPRLPRGLVSAFHEEVLAGAVRAGDVKGLFARKGRSGPRSLCRRPAGTALLR